MYLVAATLGGLLALHPGSADRPDPKLHDPLADLRRRVGEEGRAQLDAFARYDAGRIARELERISRRLEDEPGEFDPLLFAQGVLDLAWIRKATERMEELPEVLASFDVDEWTARALEVVDRFVMRHPEHSDAQRMIGDLHAARIRGMARGLLEGPKAKRAVERALELDPANARAVLALARMHYHNPPFAGGDKEKALEEFRRVARDTGDLRALLYLGRLYRERGLEAQARFFLEKAKRVAPENPEVRRMLESIAEARREGEG